MTFKDFLNSKIEYELEGSNKKYIITPFNYLFKKHKVLKSCKTSGGFQFFLLKPNVSKLHFKNWKLFRSMDLDARNSNAKIIVSDDFNYFIWRINKCKEAQFDFHDKDGNSFLNVDFVDCDDVFLRVFDRNISDLRTYETEYVSICGESCQIDDLSIHSKNIEYRCANSQVKNILLSGDKVNIEESNGKIDNSYISSEDFSLGSSSFESFIGTFHIKNIPVIKDTIWLFSKSINYNDGQIGNDDRGIIIDDNTFNKDKCLDLARAHVSYELKKVSETLREDIIDKKTDELYNNFLKKHIEEVEAYLRCLESQKKKYEEGLENVKIKTLINGKKTSLD